MLVAGSSNPAVTLNMPVAVLTVNSSLDTNARDNLITLREAILLANGDASLPFASLTVAEQSQITGTPAGNQLDEIRFDLLTGDTSIEAGASGLGALPIIRDAVTIDGTTQEGFAGTPLVELRGPSTVAGLHGVDSSGCTIRGLVVNGFASGISFGSSTGPDLVDVAIEGCFIGTDPTGTVKIGNSIGVRFDPSTGMNNCTVGGTVPEARNLISGNNVGYNIATGADCHDNFVLGNLIGTDITGENAIPNSLEGIKILDAGPNFIGGLQPGARNVVSGNGIQISMALGLIVIQGNYVGVSATGTESIDGGGTGISFIQVSQSLIGGSVASARNVISGNGSTGIHVGHTLSSGAADNVIQNNFIGTDAAGANSLGNGENGIFLSGTIRNTSVLNNVISGNQGSGILGFRSGALGPPSPTTSTALIENNLIGTDVTGTVAVGNQRNGVLLTGRCSWIIRGNTISANNQFGVAVGVPGFDSTTTPGGGNLSQIINNKIGTDSTGSNPLGNEQGGLFYDNNTFDQLVQGNVIAFNDDTGIRIPALNLGTAAGVRIKIKENTIGANGGLAIDLGDEGVTPNDAGDSDSGSNELQNFPLLSSAVFSSGTVTVNGSLNSIASTTYTLEFYYSSSSCSGEGDQFTGGIPRLLGTGEVTTDASGNASFALPFSLTGSGVGFVNCSATDPAGNTSEFSQCIQTTTPCVITCPENITVSASPGQCGAIVSYSAPTTSGSCGTVSTSPASGSFFNVGTTTVTASVSGGPSCSFTVTVIDAQAPVVTCPSNISLKSQSGSAITVNFSPGTFTDNCPGGTIGSSPVSGSLFPIGTTQVTSTATDAAGNTATCTFTVTVEACTFALTSSTAIAPSTGGPANFGIQAQTGCNWESLSNDSWISITGANSGSGNGTLAYTVAQNTGPQRQGTITAAGKTFTVTQSAAGADTDSDGVPDEIEVAQSTNPLIKDNDIFALTPDGARAFAKQQYRDFLGREGDAGGVTFWANQITSGTVSRASMVQSFFNSAEFQNSSAPVTRLYFAYFLRIPDLGGLQFWIAQLRAGTPLNTISNAFAASPEFLTRYGQLNNTDFVTLVYNNVLNRPPDAGGLAFWVGQLNSGTLTRGQVMLAFSESVEYKSKILSEVFVTQIYVGMLRRSPDQSGFAFWVGALDGGAPGINLIQSFLSSVEYHDRFLPHATGFGALSSRFTEIVFRRYS